MKSYDLNYQPEDYFFAQEFMKKILSKVKEQKRRQALERLLVRGEFDDIENLLNEKLSEEDRIKIGRIPPSLVGGKYLPDLEEDEIEIARATLSSTTFDVYSVRVKKVREIYKYSIASEYEDMK